MITVSQADKIIQNALPKYPSVPASLIKAGGRILQQDIKADRDLPPFHRSLMDGIAINLKIYNQGQRSFNVEKVQAAGSPEHKLRSTKNCVEIMTGAIVPKGCDAVVPVEQITINKNIATIKAGLKLSKWQFIRQRAADHKKGTTLLKAGVRLLPPQIAVAAGVGSAKVRVSPKLRIAVITSGDELVDIDKPVKPYQIRQSNSLFIQSALDQTRLFEPTVFHFPDNEKKLYDGIKKILAKFDVLILTGGVSMGKFDFIPKVLTRLGVKVLFHKVSQKPGKPFWFGMSKKKQPVFALPGNPVSTQVGIYRYVLPHLSVALGEKRQKQTITLGSDFTPSSDLTLFLPVVLRYDRDSLTTAFSYFFGGSGDFASLGKTDGFIEIPAGKTKINKGSIVPFYPWTF